MNKENDILKSLKNKETGFTVPEGYLENFEVLLEQKTIESKTGFTLPKDYLENLDSVILSKVSKTTNTGFKTPDNYFESVDNKILNRIDLNKKSRIISIIQTPLFKRVSYAVAASLVLFFGVKSFYFTNTVSDFDSVTTAQIDSWVEDDLLTFSTYDIAENLTDIDYDMSSDFSDEEILDYLDNTDIENLLLNE
jgi:hypothetical protein